MYKSLGRDPNAKDIELKTLVFDFDKVARKLIAKVKKGKNEQLYSRQQILMKKMMKNKNHYMKEMLNWYRHLLSNRKKNIMNMEVLTSTRQNPTISKTQGVKGAKYSNTISLSKTRRGMEGS